MCLGSFSLAYTTVVKQTIVLSHKVRSLLYLNIWIQTNSNVFLIIFWVSKRGGPLYFCDQISFTFCDEKFDTKNPLTYLILICIKSAKKVTSRALVNGQQHTLTISVGGQNQIIGYNLIKGDEQIPYLARVRMCQGKGCMDGVSGTAVDSE